MALGRWLGGSGMGLSDLGILLYRRGCVLRGGVGVCLIFMLILLAVSGLGFRFWAAAAAGRVGVRCGFWFGP